MGYHEVDVKSETEAGNLTQADVNEHIGSYNAPLLKQLDDLTLLLQRMSSTQQPNFYLRACTGASFSSAGYPPDI